MELIEQTKQIAELTDSEIEDIFLLAQAYYVESKSVFSRELEHNNMIYLSLWSPGRNIKYRMKKEKLFI